MKKGAEFSEFLLDDSAPEAIVHMGMWMESSCTRDERNAMILLLTRMYARQPRLRPSILWALGKSGGSTYLTMWLRHKVLPSLCRIEANELYQALIAMENLAPQDGYAKRSPEWKALCRVKTEYGPSKDILKRLRK